MSPRPLRDPVSKLKKESNREGCLPLTSDLHTYHVHHVYTCTHKGWGEYQQRWSWSWDGDWLFRTQRRFSETYSHFYLSAFTRKNAMSRASIQQDKYPSKTHQVTNVTTLYYQAKLVERLLLSNPSPGVWGLQNCQLIPKGGVEG